MRMTIPASIVASLLVVAPVLAADKLDFARDIRPILSDACFKCHGPDPTTREADLRLDTEEGARADLGGHFAVVPGHPESSELLRRILSNDPDEVMPPPSTGKSISPAQREKLAEWIRQGAGWSTHWSFTPPVRPEVPRPANADWVNNYVDAFVLARLEKEGLKPSPQADKVTLLRRLSLDLTGLPPTIAEVDAFLADKTSDAYQKQVERLLESPHYGERWGRLWLDAARYADSDGYEKDKPRFVYFYRDWVVKALNNDLPYNEFLIDQLAGDLLPEPTQDQLVATGFLRNSMINEEGGIDPEQFRMEAMFDRMDAIGKSVLGLTVGCAQCHTHKYDPLTQTDYYRMFACLNNASEASAPVYAPDQLQQRANILRQIGEIEDDLRHRHPDWLERMRAWEDSVRGNQPEWQVLRPELDTSGGQKHYLLDDGSILAAGYAPTKHTTEFAGKIDLPKITAVRLEMLNDPSLPLGGPGRSIFGLCALSEFQVTVAPADKPGEAKPVKIASVTADVNPAEEVLDPTFNDKTDTRRVTGPAAYAIDGKNETAWSLDAGPGRSNVPRKAVFVLETPVEFPQGAMVTCKLVQMHGGWNSDDNQNNNLGRFRLSATSADAPTADPLPARVRELITDTEKVRSPAEDRTVFSYWRTQVEDWTAENQRIEELWASHPKSQSQLVLLEREAPRMTRLLERGDFLKPKDPVSPGVPEFLSGKTTPDIQDRLDFARWIADPQSPTTGRAIVNRVWQTYFGTGFVSTAEDLGSQGELPSHPELLDWLTVELIDSGWSLKHLHRLIVLSNTYKQSSAASDELLARDPDNRLLARASRFRLEAEVVRDISLAASGLLNREVGGPPVYPPAPDFLFQPPASYGPKVWKESTGPERYRRALYTFRFRSVPYPMLQTFDAPNGDSACVRRVRSNTPLQALTSLNEPLFLECARALALTTVQKGGTDDDARLTYAVRRCLVRTPSPEEAGILRELLNEQKANFSQPDAKPWELAANDPENPPALPEGVTPADLAAWTAVSRVLLNLDETITRE